MREASSISSEEVQLRDIVIKLSLCMLRQSKLLMHAHVEYRKSFLLVEPCEPSKPQTADRLPTVTRCMKAPNAPVYNEETTIGVKPTDYAAVEDLSLVLVDYQTKVNYAI